MTHENIEETVKRIVVERLGRKPEEVSMDAKIIDDLRADSLDVTELLMALEEEYKIELDDEAHEIKTVGDAVRFIKSKVESGVGAGPK